MHKELNIFEKIYRGFTEIVKYLIDVGGNLDIQNSDGYTALIGATVWGNTEVVQHLIEAGADLNLQYEDGQTALFWACRNGYT